MRAGLSLPLLVLVLALASPALAQQPSQRMANYFFCELNEGKTVPDLLAFKVEYEKAVSEAGLEGYELRVQIPMYSEEIGPGRFVWDGSWGTIEDMARISAWFQGSEWPARFRAIMTCERSSLWRILD